MLSVDTLLAGPRGRRFVMEFLIEGERARSPEGPWPLDAAVMDAAGPFEDQTGPAYATLAAPPFRLWWAARALPVRALLRPAPLLPALLRPVWPVRRLPMRRRRKASAGHPPAQSPAQVAQRISAATLPPATDDVARAALRASVNAAMYWQPPDGVDGLCRTAEVREALRPAAQLLAESEFASWFDADMDPLDQYECWPDDESAWPGGLTVDWHEWRASVVESEHHSRSNLGKGSRSACVDGVWASVPFPAAAVTTRRVRSVPLGLDMEEDSMQPEAATVNRCAVHPGSRVLEIDGAETWAQLCQQYPLEVSAQMRGMWWDTTGRDGRWVIPDWSRVAEHYDAVHMQGRAYLAAAGTAIDVDGDAASVIAGWTPDSTVWFTRVGLTGGEARRWSLDEDEAWRPDWTGPSDGVASADWTGSRD